MDAIRLFFVESINKLQTALQAPETPPNQLSVGLFGDIPTFPPLLLEVFVVITIFTKLFKPFDFDLFYNKTTPTSRTSALVCGICIFGLCVSSSESGLRDAGTSAAFYPMQQLATTHAYRHSRNPIYACGSFVLGPSIAVIFDSFYSYVLLGWIIPGYFHFIVIPAEESKLLELFKVSERSERAFWKTRNIRATTKLKLFSILWLASLASPLLH